MNFAFVVVVLAAVSGLGSELALRSVAPSAGPALALFIMAVALIGAAWKQGKAKETTKPERAAGASSAVQSLSPV